MLEQMGAEKVHLARFLLVGQEQAIPHAAKGRALLHREAVGRDVVGREREQGAQGVEIAFPCLVGNAQHHVGREIGKACLTCALCRAAEVVEGVRAAKRLQLALVCALQTDAQAVEAERAQMAKIGKPSRARIAFGGDLGIGHERKRVADALHHARHLLLGE